MNLNEIHIPPQADEAMKWACMREFGLRYDSYRESLVRGVGLAEVIAYFCFNPEEDAWFHSVRAELLA